MHFMLTLHFIQNHKITTKNPKQNHSNKNKTISLKSKHLKGTWKCTYNLETIYQAVTVNRFLTKIPF